jgi:hypothetical protein
MSRDANHEGDHKSSNSNRARAMPPKRPHRHAFQLKLLKKTVNSRERELLVHCVSRMQVNIGNSEKESSHEETSAIGLAAARAARHDVSEAQQDPSQVEFSDARSPNRRGGRRSAVAGAIIGAPPADLGAGRPGLCGYYGVLINAVTISTRTGRSSAPSANTASNVPHCGFEKEGGLRAALSILAASCCKRKRRRGGFAAAPV